MRKLQTVLAKRNKLKNARQNTPVVAHQGKYSYESTLVLRLGDLEDLTEELLDKISNYGKSFGFGDEYESIVRLVEKFNNYQKAVLNSVHGGRDWKDFPCKNHQESQKINVGDGVFGKTWDEIEEMQGGKIKK